VCVCDLSSLGKSVREELAAVSSTMISAV